MVIHYLGIARYSAWIVIVRVKSHGKVLVNYYDTLFFPLVFGIISR